MITYMNRGIANVFPGGRIEVHKKLKRPEYAPLFQKIMEHEAAHTDFGWAMSDFQNDLHWLTGVRKMWWKFVLTTPSSWIQFFPLYRSNKKTYLDPTLLIFWAVSLVIIFSWIYLMWRLF